MNGNNRVEITDKEGWRKEFPLPKQLVYIGSDAKNDIVLDTWRGAGVQPRHLQLIGLPGGMPGCRVINLADTDIQMGDGALLAPRSAAQLADGHCLRVGDFQLVFRFLARSDGLAGGPGYGSIPLPSTPGATAGGAAGPLRAAAAGPVPAMPAWAPGTGGPYSEGSSPAIACKFALSQPALSPHAPVEGTISICNLGTEPGVQFRIEMEGLDPDCYEIGPGPILFPNVEKAVFVRLYHPRRPGLAAGRLPIRIRVSAPEAYPGQAVSVTREIELLPFYSHSLRLVAQE